MNKVNKNFKDRVLFRLGLRLRFIMATVSNSWGFLGLELQGLSSNKLMLNHTLELGYLLLLALHYRKQLLLLRFELQTLID